MAIEFDSSPFQGEVNISETNKATETLVYNLDNEVKQLSQQEAAQVRYGVSYTKNMGNYEFMKVEVNVTRPALNTPSTIDAAHELNREWVEDKLEQVLSAIEEAAGGGA